MTPTTTKLRGTGTRYRRRRTRWDDAPTLTSKEKAALAARALNITTSTANITATPTIRLPLPSLTPGDMPLRDPLGFEFSASGFLKGANHSKTNENNGPHIVAMGFFYFAALLAMVFVLLAFANRAGWLDWMWKMMGLV